MSVHLATTGAIAFSATTVILCMAGLIMVYNDLQAIWQELDFEMDQFKLQTDDWWKDMLTMGAGTPANRQRRQAYGGYGAAGQQQFPSGGQSGGGGLPMAHVATGPLSVGLGR